MAERAAAVEPGTVGVGPAGCETADGARQARLDGGAVETGERDGAGEPAHSTSRPSSRTARGRAGD